MTLRPLARVRSATRSAYPAACTVAGIAAIVTQNSQQTSTTRRPMLTCPSESSMKPVDHGVRRGGRVVEGARLLSVCTSQGCRGFKSRPLRSPRSNGRHRFGRLLLLLHRATPTLALLLRLGDGAIAAFGEFDDRQRGRIAATNA